MRTSAANLELDAHFDTGFVGNPKRFNTALSRAVALAVVVGGARGLRSQPAAATTTHRHLLLARHPACPAFPLQTWPCSTARPSGRT